MCLRCLLGVDTVEKTFDFEGDIDLMLDPSFYSSGDSFSMKFSLLGRLLNG